MSNNQELWRYGFTNHHFGLMKEGPYVLLEQVRAHYEERLAKQEQALKWIAELGNREQVKIAMTNPAKYSNALESYLGSAIHTANKVLGGEQQ